MDLRQGLEESKVQAKDKLSEKEGRGGEYFSNGGLPEARKVLMSSGRRAEMKRGGEEGGGVEKGGAENGGECRNSGTGEEEKKRQAKKKGEGRRRKGTLGEGEAEKRELE